MRHVDSLARSRDSVGYDDEILEGRIHALLGKELTTRGLRRDAAEPDILLQYPWLSRSGAGHRRTPLRLLSGSLRGGERHASRARHQRPTADRRHRPMDEAPRVARGVHR
ncbi:MAG: DUF4136 domain-containing protein [Gemmatimonas sp.]